MRYEFKNGKVSPSLQDKVMKFAKQERIGNEFVDEDGYVYTLTDINKNDKELYITKSTHPKLKDKDCRWNENRVEKIIKTGEF